MNRADLDRLRLAMVGEYHAQLVREQPQLSSEERASMCRGFNHGQGWLLKVLEAAGVVVEAEGPTRSMFARAVCRCCRRVVGDREPVRWRERAPGVTVWECPQCQSENEAP